MMLAGEKKCRPTTSCGRLVTAAISSTSSVEVLVAMMAPGLAILSSLAKISFFSAMFSNTASMMRSALPQILQLQRRRQLGQALLGLRLGGAAALDVGLQRVLDARDALVERLLRGLDDGQRDSRALRKASADARAHGAGAENADRLDVAQLHVGADAGQVGGLPLGEERVLQRARIGAGGGLAEQLRARAAMPSRQRQGGRRLHRVDGSLRRDRAAGMAAERAARLLEQAGRNRCRSSVSPMRRGGLPTCSLAKATAAATTSPSASLSIRPAAAPLAASMKVPVVMSCRACSTPMARGRRCVPPAPGMMPSLISGRPSWRTSLVATR